MAQNGKKTPLGTPPMRKAPIRRNISTPRKRKLNPAGIALFIGVLAVLAIVVLSLWQILFSRDVTEENHKAKEEQLILTAESGEAEDPAPWEGGRIEFDFVEKSEEDVHDGNLILVNYENEYVFPKDESRLDNVYARKTQNYKVAYSDYMLASELLDSFNALTDKLCELTGDRCILVNSAYRSLEEQKSIYDDYEENYGSDYAKSYVAVPGYSEHHTGLAADLGITYDDGTAVIMRDYENLGTFLPLASEHGFIVRYPAGKEDVTHISNEPWHFRYVGVPHASIIEFKEYCLEEYLEYIKSFTCDGVMIAVGASGRIFTCTAENVPETCYLIYYVEADASGVTKVPVPENADSYRISGDNVKGFVVDAVFGTPMLPSTATEE